MKLPYAADVRVKTFSPELLDRLALSPFCFFLDSAGHEGPEGRYSFFGIRPVRTFSSAGGLVTIIRHLTPDPKPRAAAHTFIDNPVDALKRFEQSLFDLPLDPYLPFSGGLVGFVGHSWPAGTEAKSEQFDLPDAWFGLFDTILTFDHLEGSCWVSSMGITERGEASPDLARSRCDEILSLIERESSADQNRYIIKPLTPGPASNFTKDAYIRAVETARESLTKADWQRANLARRFYAPVATSAWSIHKLLRKKNPTPYSCFLRCGTFEISSTSPSAFLKLKGGELTCTVVQKGIAKVDDPARDLLNRTELLSRSMDEDPAVLDDRLSIRNVIKGAPEVLPGRILSDARSHFLVNRIEGERKTGSTATDCLTAALPGAAMTGVPKIPVNTWLKKTEPAKRDVYTGAIGYIGADGNAQFNTAVRTMIIRDQVASVHAGWQIEGSTDAEEAFCRGEANIDRLFEGIRELGHG